MTLNKVTVESALKNLCNNIDDSWVGNLAKNYGEATESLNENQAGNYVTLDGAEYCSVDDTKALVLFIIRESASVENIPAGGRKNSLLRTVTFRLVCNSTSPSAEFALTSILNRTTGITYEGTDFDSKGIASRYFGIQERNFETYFFAITFRCTEKISCEITC